MSEELPLNDRRGNLIQGPLPKSIFPYRCKNLALNGIQTLAPTIHDQPHQSLRYVSLIFINCDHFYFSNKLYFGERNRDHSKMINESVKNSLEKSRNVLEEKSKIVKQKICIKHSWQIARK